MKFQEYNNKFKIDKKWMENFQKLIKYQKKTGKSSPPISNNYKGIPKWVQNLSKWCVRQRVRLKSGEIKSWQYTKLVSAGFNFEPRYMKFEEHLKELLDFKEKFGHTKVHTKSKEYSVLAHWVYSLRYNPPSGWKKDSLDEIGFEWIIKEDSWQEDFQMLELFWKTNGHFRVPIIYEGSKSLRYFVMRMRKYKKSGIKTQLTDERIKLLDSIGFEWTPLQNIWERNFQKLVRHIEKNGNRIVHTDFFYDESLYSWIQQLKKRKANLPQYQIDKLNEIGFNWKNDKVIDNDNWAQHINKLHQFIAQFGHCLVPIRRCNIKTLGSWVAWLRKNKHKLSPEKIASLDLLGFEWDADAAYRMRNKIKPRQKK